MSDKLQSQSFLGPDSDEIFGRLTVGLVGLGGGGCHLAQQLAHLGVGGFVLVDHDIIEEKNLNRLVGGTVADVLEKRAKTEIANRVIKAVNPDARVIVRQVRWQEALPELRSCDVIFGAVDSYRERAELERFTRRFLVPYLDLGMDVHKGEQGYSMSGQAVLSSPGGPCLWCLGILTDARLQQEAAQYGKSGGRPQVVWTNGVLASLAIGLFVQLVCPWHRQPQLAACCEFDGNRHVVETNRMDAVGGTNCRHYEVGELGDQFFAQSVNEKAT